MPEIADELYVSLNTVRPHMRHHPSHQAEDLGDQGGAMPGVAVEQGRSGVLQEQHERTVGLGEVKRVFQGASGGGVVEAGPGDLSCQQRWGRLRGPGTYRAPSAPGPAATDAPSTVCEAP
jgi:hypothetical protein